jgi:hypothetical protein
VRSESCVVALVDRLIHRAEVIDIDVDSKRFKVGDELTAGKKCPWTLTRVSLPSRLHGHHPSVCSTPS